MGKNYGRFKAGDVYSVVAKGAKLMPCPCLVWMRSTSPSGRPIMKSGGVTRVIYRVLWEAENGEIPANLTIDHTCQNKRCLNLDHLELVTEDENRRRAREMDGNYSTKKSNTQAIRDVLGILVDNSLLSQDRIPAILKEYGKLVTPRVSKGLK